MWPQSDDPTRSRAIPPSPTAMAAWKNNPALDHDIAHYLAAAESACWGNAYPSNDLFERLTGHRAYLRQALIKEIERGERSHWLPPP